MKSLGVLCLALLYITVITMQPVIGIEETQFGAETILQKRFSVSGRGTFVLDAAIGTVDVRSVTSNIVTVKVSPQIKTNRVEDRQRLLSNVIVDATQNQNDVRVIAKLRPETPDDDRRQVRLHFEVSVPHNYNLDLNTVGSVAVGDLRGDVKVATAGSGVSLGNIEGGVSVDSSGGSLTAGRVIGPSKAVTEGGPVTFKEVLDSVQVETGGGSFTAYLAQQPRSESRVSTGGGGIDMRVAKNVGVELDARTTNGRVMADDPALVERHAKLNTLQTNINGGGPKLVLRAEGGCIRVRTHPASIK